MFDVRVLVVSVVLMDALVLASLPRHVDLIAALVLIGLLILHRLWRQFAWLLVTAALLLGTAQVLRLLQGPVAGALGIAVTFVWRYCLAGAFGWFLITVVRPTEFVAAMTRLRIPRFLLVPIAVVLRFIPTVATEARAIGDAMRMRGLVTGPWSMVRHPIRTSEHLVIPLLAAAVRAGDELTASALSRGFGSSSGRTTIVDLRLGLADLLLAVVVAVVAAHAFGILP